jgi:hypothetical protein
MGREARCRARWGDEDSEGRALLETDEVVFRGGFRVTVPFREMRRVEARGDVLEIDAPSGTLVLDLGVAEAQRWAQRILDPPSLLDKLGVKPGASVAVDGVDDPGFRTDLAARAGDVAEGPPGAPCDVVVWAVEDVAELAGSATHRAWIRADGAVWVVWRKGRRELTENHVREAALAAGLVDVKVARFSDTHSALKLVVPRAARAAPGKGTRRPAG